MAKSHTSRLYILWMALLVLPLAFGILLWWYGAKTGPNVQLRFILRETARALGAMG